MWPAAKQCGAFLHPYTPRCTVPCCAAALLLATLCTCTPGGPCRHIQRAPSCHEKAHGQHAERSCSAVVPDGMQCSAVEDEVVVERDADVLGHAEGQLAVEAAGVARVVQRVVRTRLQGASSMQARAGRQAGQLALGTDTHGQQPAGCAPRTRDVTVVAKEKGLLDERPCTLCMTAAAPCHRRRCECSPRQ